MSESNISNAPHYSQTYKFDVNSLTPEESKTFAEESLPIAVPYLWAKLNEADSNDAESNDADSNGAEKKDAHSRRTVELRDHNASEIRVSNYEHMPMELKDPHRIDALSLPRTGKDGVEGKPLSIVFTKQPDREGRITIYENTIATVVVYSPREQSLNFESPDGVAVGTTGLGTVYPYERDGYTINLFTPNSISNGLEGDQLSQEGTSSNEGESWILRGEIQGARVTVSPRRDMQSVRQGEQYEFQPQTPF
jgi:hypothetical protein